MGPGRSAGGWGEGGVKRKRQKRKGEARQKEVVEEEKRGKEEQQDVHYEQSLTRNRGKEAEVEIESYKLMEEMLHSLRQNQAYRIMKML